MFKLIKHNTEKEELIEPMVESLLIKPCHVISKCGPPSMKHQSKKETVDNKDSPKNNWPEDPEKIFKKENDAMMMV